MSNTNNITGTGKLIVTAPINNTVITTSSSTGGNIVWHSNNRTYPISDGYSDVGMATYEFQTSISIDGKTITMPYSEYNLILKMGYEALERKKQFEKDFKDVVEK